MRINLIIGVLIVVALLIVGVAELIEEWSDSQLFLAFCVFSLTALLGFLIFLILNW